MFVKQNLITVAEQTTKKSKKPIGQRWRLVIDAKGLKQTWIAEQVGISPEHLSNILSDRVLITEENRIKINEVLETNFKI